MGNGSSKKAGSAGQARRQARPSGSNGDSTAPADERRRTDESADDASVHAGSGAADDDMEELEEPPEGATEPEKMSWFTMLRLGYDQVVNAIIRPPRARYTERDLGPPEFDFRGRSFQRSDFIVRNARGMKIVCSHWQPKEGSRPASQLPCVIYLHGNSSCRIGCLENLEVVLGEGASLLAFDCTGSGLSDGEYVTLGWYERDDLAAVIDHLRASGTVSTVALWGRSMGAATALLHAHRDPTIAGMVLDSPFADLRQLAQEIVEIGKAQTGYRVPGFVVGGAIRIVRSTVLKKTGMDIFSLRPIADVDKSFVPALFVAGESDNFIAPHHSKQLFDKYAGDKNLVIVPGDHNTLRPKFFQDGAAIFLRTVLHIEAGISLESPLARAGASHRVHHSLEASWRGAAGGDDSVDSAAAARAASVAAEEAMIQQALMASMLTATAGGVRMPKAGKGSGGTTNAVANGGCTGRGAGKAEVAAVTAPTAEARLPSSMSASALETLQHPGNVLSRTDGSESVSPSSPVGVDQKSLKVGPPLLASSPVRVSGQRPAAVVPPPLPSRSNDFIGELSGADDLFGDVQPRQVNMREALSPPTAVVSEDAEDEDLRRAIAMSLQDQHSGASKS